MSRDQIFVLALGALTAAALAVGASGWVLFVRERRLAAAGRAAHATVDVPVDAVAAHHEANEEE